MSGTRLTNWNILDGAHNIHELIKDLEKKEVCETAHMFIDTNGRNELMHDERRGVLNARQWDDVLLELGRMFRDMTEVTDDSNPYGQKVNKRINSNIQKLKHVFNGIRGWTDLDRINQLLAIITPDIQNGVDRHPADPTSRRLTMAVLGNIANIIIRPVYPYGQSRPLGAKVPTRDGFRVKKGSQLGITRSPSPGRGSPSMGRGGSPGYGSRGGSPSLGRGGRSPYGRGSPGLRSSGSNDDFGPGFPGPARGRGQIGPIMTYFTDSAPPPGTRAVLSRDDDFRPGFPQLARPGDQDGPIMTYFTDSHPAPGTRPLVGRQGSRGGTPSPRGGSRGGSRGASRSGSRTYQNNDSGFQDY